MGLFGNNSNQPYQQEEELKLEQEQRQLELKFDERKNYVANQPGIVVELQGEKGEKLNYKFINDPDVFLFIYYIRSHQSYSQSIYEKELSYEDIRLDKKLYNAELLKDYNQIQQSDEYVGEMRVREKPISIKFSARDKTEIVISITNLDQDFSVLGTFMQDLGVKNYRNVINIPEETFMVQVLNGDSFLAKSKYIFFRDRKELYFIRESKAYTYSGIRDIQIAQININKIQYYKSEGSLRYEQEISGGGGAGVNYGGAVVGGLLFGNAGALIGSRHNEDIEQIQTKTITHDDRIVLLVLRTKGKTYQIGFDVDSELAFDWLIPEKQYDYVISKRRKMYEDEIY